LIAAHEEPQASARHQVALVTGCIQDLVFADVNRDTADVLLANGCAVDAPPVQPCCGSLHAHNGDLEGARTLARRMIDLCPPDRYDAIISNAPRGRRSRWPIRCRYSPAPIDGKSRRPGLSAPAWKRPAEYLYSSPPGILWRTPHAVSSDLDC
jgi:hypothetical protein